MTFRFLFFGGSGIIDLAPLSIFPLNCLASRPSLIPLIGPEGFCQAWECPIVSSCFFRGCLQRGGGRMEKKKGDYEYTNWGAVHREHFYSIFVFRLCRALPLAPDSFGDPQTLS